MLATQKQVIEAHQRAQDFLRVHTPPDSPGYAFTLGDPCLSLLIDPILLPTAWDSSAATRCRRPFAQPSDAMDS